jgi:hypothetical protein
VLLHPPSGTAHIGGFMEHFTQLNLQSKAQEKKSQPQPTSTSETYFGGKQKTAALFGMLAATALVGGFLFETACSSADKPAHTAIAAPSVPAAMTMTAPAAPIVPAAMSDKPQPKRVRQHKLVASTYKNADYGVSFQYPRKYRLLEGDKANLQWTGVGPVEMNFAQPGGETLSAVALPKGAYPNSDFSSAFFNLSVHPKLTSAECERFRFSKDSDSAKQPARVKLGAADFTEVEDSAGDPTKRADAKYYHLYQNSTCYEFMLGVETASGKITDAPVNRNEVFRKLNWMLSTVKIEPAGVPAQPAPEVAKGTASAPAAESKN